MDPRESFVSRYISNVSTKRLLCYGIILLSVVVIIILLITLLPGGEGSSETKPGSYVLKKTPLIDGSNSLPTELMKRLKSAIDSFPFEKDLTADTQYSWCQTDLPRLKKGMVGTQIWTVRVPCSSQYKDAATQTMQQIDLILRLVKKYKNDMRLVNSAEDIDKAFDDHKIGSMIGITGGHSIDNKLAVLRTYYNLGVRYLTLTADCNTPWSASFKNDATSTFTLSEFGQTIVKEMNRLGMIIDLSLLSTKAQMAVLELSKAPCIFSSSALDSLNELPQNIKSSVLEEIKKKKGLIMISFDGNLMRNATTKTVAMKAVIAHINEVRQKIGVDYVGLGAGFNTEGSMVVEGLKDTSTYPELFDQLASMKPDDVMWKPEELKKLAGLNFIKLLQEVEKVRDEITEKPYENLIPSADIKKEDQTCYTNL